MQSARKLRNSLLECQFLDIPILKKISEYLPLETFPNTDKEIISTVASEDFVIDEYYNELIITFVNEAKESQLNCINKHLNYFFKKDPLVLFYIIKYLLQYNLDFEFDNSNLFLGNNLNNSVCVCLASKNPVYYSIGECFKDFLSHKDCKTKKILMIELFNIENSEGEVFFINDKVLEVKERLVYVNGSMHEGMTYLYKKGVNIKEMYNFYF